VKVDERSESEFVADVQTIASKLGLSAELTGTSETVLSFSLAAAPRKSVGE
jgi:hypothetical protein